MPFELYEVKQYDGNVVSVNQINENKTIKSNTADTTKDDKISKVSKEIIVYTEDDALSKASDVIKELYSELRGRIVELGNIKIEPKKLYIAFKGKTNICDIVVSRNALKIFINLKEGELKDKQGLARVVKDIGHWGNGDYEIAVSDNETFDYVISLIKQSIEANG